MHGKNIFQGNRTFFKTCLITGCPRSIPGFFHCRSNTVVFRWLLTRSKIRENSRFFVEQIAQKGLARPFIFVDEVQKEPEIFDAVKMAFDKSKASFIVSGSNPAFLNTAAGDRLQRRGIKMTLWPLSIPEIAVSYAGLKKFEMKVFSDLLWHLKNPLNAKIPVIRKPDDMDKLTATYLIRGGLPLAVKSSSNQKALTQILPLGLFVG